MSRVRVLIAEDFVQFRDYISSELTRERDLKIVCEVGDGQQAVQKAAELKPDLILLDIGLPTLNGIMAARQIRKLLPDSKIIFVSQETSADVVQEALSTGANGYVVKAKAGRDLLSAVDKVLSGGPFLSEELFPA